MIDIDGNKGLSMKGSTPELMADLATVVYAMIRDLDIDKNLVKEAVIFGIKTAKAEGGNE